MNSFLFRSPWGTPHVFAATDQGAMFGLGYASAEDRHFQMRFNRLVMQGRVTEVFGALGGKGAALQNDKQMRTLGAYRAAQAIVGNLGEPTRQLLQAFTDGVNHYTAVNKPRLHPLFVKTITARLEENPQAALQPYTQVVDLGNPDASLSLLPFGNSERPDSPFRFASWAAWVRSELRPAPLSRKAVEKSALSRMILQPHAKDEVAGSPPDREDAR